MAKSLDSLEIAFTLSDSASTAESSSNNENSLLLDDYEDEDGENYGAPTTRTFQKIIDAIFHDKAHKTVLLSSSQLREVHEAIATDFTRILLCKSSTSSSCLHDLDVHIHCYNHILDQFWDSQELILQSSMATTAQESLFQVVEDYLIPRLVDQINPMRHLSLASTAKAIAWISSVQDDLTRVAPDLVMRKEWSESRDKLIEYYMNSAWRKELKVQLGHLLDGLDEDDIRCDLHGNLVTGLTEQIAQIIHQHVMMARECLPKQHWGDLLAICNEELSSMVCNWTIKVSSEWREMCCAFSCAILNDMAELVEYCKESNKALSKKFKSSNHVASDINELSLLVTQLLCKRLIQNLREPKAIIDSIGSAAWENQDAAAPVESVITTFQDFFSDLKHWVRPGPSFPRILKCCFDLSLTVYLESFFTNTMAGGINDPSVVAAELEQDYLRLVVFFNGENFAKYHNGEDFYCGREVNDRVRILQHMAALVDPTNLPCNLSFEIQEVLASFREREDGKRAVLHLVGLRQRGRSTDTAIWLELIQLAEKDRSTRCTDETPTLLFMLPDARAAKMWQRRSSSPRFQSTRQPTHTSRPKKRLAFFSASIDPIPSAESVPSETMEQTRVRRQFPRVTDVAPKDRDGSENITIDMEESEKYDFDEEEGFFEGTTMAEF